MVNPVPYHTTSTLYILVPTNEIYYNRLQLEESLIYWTCYKNLHTYEISLPDFSKIDLWSIPSNPTYEFGFEVMSKLTFSPGATSSGATLMSTLKKKHKGET